MNPYDNVTIPQFIQDNDHLMRAYEFASNAHETRCTVNADGSPMHLRKYGTNEAYIIHPIAVAAILWKAGITNIKMLQAALLHDTVEDTSVTLDEIRQMFGKRVAAMVDGLTDPEVEGTRDERKAACRTWTSKQDPETLTIKTADLIHNTIDITARDPDFAVSYTHEKALLLKAILKGGQSIKSDRGLYLLAVKQLETYHFNRAVEKFELHWATEANMNFWDRDDKATAQHFFIEGIKRGDERYRLVIDLVHRINNSE